MNGPWRVVNADKQHVHSVQNTVSGEVNEVHVVHLLYSTEDALEVTSELKEVFQHAFAQGQF